MNADTLVQILKLFAGIGLFLFAMKLIEDGLKELSGRNFKIFLQRITKNNLGAIAGGTVVTGILQSSSLVSMMVLAFVGAGIFTLRNALAIILGANLGTTLNGWIVATLGFKVNIEVASYPAVGIGGLLLIIAANNRTLKYTAHFLLGFGLLFIGLAFMKTAMDAQTLDLSRFLGMPIAIFLLVGFLVTTLLQSSSVTMALTLSALHAGTITLPVAAALVMGSETGTSIKLLIGAIGGNPVKKRVAAGSLLFNVVPTIVIFVFLETILRLITDVLHINDPLISLVTFSSLFNLTTIALFTPFLGPFTKFLEQYFGKTSGSHTAYLIHANVDEPETALDLFKKETHYFIYASMRFNLSLLEIETQLYPGDPEFEQEITARKLFSDSADETYKYLKRMQGEMQVFYMKFRSRTTGIKIAELDKLNAAIRSSMYSIKCIKDVRANISNLMRSSKDVKFALYQKQRKFIEDLYHTLGGFMQKRQRPASIEFQTALNNIGESYNGSLSDFYGIAEPSVLQDLDVSTIINFSREVFSANKAMLSAVKDLVLDADEAREIQ